MKKTSLITFLNLLALPLFFFAANAFAVQPIPPGVTWFWQLRGAPSPGNPAQVVDYDVDIYQDHQGPDPNVMALRNAGKEVICYFSTQYEDWRTDMRNLSEIERRLGQKLKGNVLDDWPGERFINTRSQAVRDLMQARMVRAKKMGCTGVEPDNVDFYSFTTGFRLTKADTIDYMRFLSNTAHRLDLKIALKNADAIAAQVNAFIAANHAVEPRWIDYSHRRTPLPRLGRSEDVANAALFLASDESTFITGENLMVDGGWMAS
mgnify:CR=1 FL=1